MPIIPLNIIVNPLTPYAILALVLVLTLALFMNLKYEVSNSQKRLRDRCKELEDRLVATVNLLEERTATGGKSIELKVEAGHRSPARHAPNAVQGLEPTNSNSMDLARRSQAIQLHRLGQSNDEIAEVLQLPRNEVDLLLKVHQTVLGSQGLLKELAALR